MPPQWREILQETIKVMLVEDHALVRAGLTMILSKSDGIDVVAEAKNGREALKILQAVGPHVVLMDITMPDMNGLDAAAHIIKHFPDIRVIMLSMHDSEELVAQALRAGVHGYLLKDSATAEMELAIRAVARGGKFLCPAVSGHVVSQYLMRVDSSLNPLDKLTPRQREVFHLLVDGHTTQAMARTLKISPKTVETHRLQLMERLDIHDVPSLVRLAIRCGITSSQKHSHN
jgi:DNA-binding NarL/FixJ family response regulator